MGFYKYKIIFKKFNIFIWKYGKNRIIMVFKWHKGFEGKNESINPNEILAWKSQGKVCVIGNMREMSKIESWGIYLFYGNSSIYVGTDNFPSLNDVDLEHERTTMQSFPSISN